MSLAHSESILPKRKRSLSPGSNGEPPLSRRRSNSPSEDSESGSTGPSPLLPQKTAPDFAELDPKTNQHSLAKGESDAAQKEKEKETTLRAEFAKLLNTRSGGVYIPPARLRALQEAASADKSSTEYQRLSWDALRKSITGIVNRVNVINIKQIVPDLFSENLIRGRGLFARSIMKAQAASLPFTPVFAALVAIINTKLPQVGELVVTRLISQFRRAFKRNDKTVCHSTTTFLAHLVNQAVANEIIVLQVLVLLLERPTDDSIEIAVGLTREVGAFLAENSPKSNNIVYGRFRDVLNEGRISHRVQYMIEVLMQVRKDKYKDNPIIPEGLDLVEEEEQITHQIQLEEELQIQEGLNIFKFDPSYLETEEKYKAIKAEILGEDSEEDSESEDESDGSEDEGVQEKEGIEDRTETNLVNLRRVIYLTIMNALNYEEAVHKLLKVQLQEGQEIELVNMIIECCSQERSYSKFYGLVGERLCKLNRVWTDTVEQAFGNYYHTIHRYETNRLRNIARFFGCLFSSDAISWMVMECVKINEDDTTSSGRIFIKIMMQEMMESMGLKELAERFKDPDIKHGCAGMFPMDIPKNTRFSINYFTSIGLGILTEEMRQYLQNAPKLIMEQRRAMLEAESSSSDTESSSDSDSDSSDSSDESSDDDDRRPRNTRRNLSRPSSRSRTPRRDRRHKPRSRSVSSSSRSSAPAGRPIGNKVALSRHARRDSRSPVASRGKERNESMRSRSPPLPHRGRERSRLPLPRGGRDQDRMIIDRGSYSRGGESQTRMNLDGRRRHIRPSRSSSTPPRYDDKNGHDQLDHSPHRSSNQDRDRPPHMSNRQERRRVDHDQSRSPPPHMNRNGRPYDDRRPREATRREKDRDGWSESRDREAYTRRR